MKNTLIEWAHHTVNFWWGCTFARLRDGTIREECKHCYALMLSKIFSRGKATWGPEGNRMIRHEAARRELYKMDKSAHKRGVRERVFINSMSDTFEDRRDLDEARGFLWDACKFVTNLDILLLTKRPENVCRMVPPGWIETWPAHVWVGTTAGTQAAADEAIPHLVGVPAKVKFLSMEPLLEEVDINDYLDPIDGGYVGRSFIDWIIVGGESGPHARPMHPAWARSLRDQCDEACVPFFFKQWGEWLPGDHVENVPDHEPQKIVTLALDGTQANSVTMPHEKREGMKTVCRIGKKVAGRLLDGRDWNEVPK